MSFAFALFVAAFVAIIIFQRRALRARPADFEAMRAYAETRGLRVISIRQNNGHWIYWLRGRLSLSNMARTFVLLAEAPDGAQTEVHFAFDPWNTSEGLQVLRERSLGKSPTSR